MAAEGAVVQIIAAQRFLQALRLVIQVENGANPLSGLDFLVGIQCGNGLMISAWA